MDPRRGSLPPYIRPVPDQPKFGPFIEFFQSSDMTVLLIAAVIVMAGLIAINTGTSFEAPDDPGYYAAAFG
jgi:hypothetical protein